MEQGQRGRGNPTVGWTDKSIREIFAEESVDFNHSTLKMYRPPALKDISRYAHAKVVLVFVAFAKASNYFEFSD